MNDSQPTSKELAAIIKKVGARMPSSVTPATRIEVHPSEWLTLVDAVTASAHEPLVRLLAAEINALPERVRKFVHDLETRADPAGDVREAHVAKETANALAARVAELEGACQPPRAERPDFREEAHEVIADVLFDKGSGDSDEGVLHAKAVVQALADENLIIGGPYSPQPPPAEHPDLYKRCQHELLKRPTTIEVINVWKARCLVCLEFFDLPGRPTATKGVD